MSFKSNVSWNVPCCKNTSSCSTIPPRNSSNVLSFLTRAYTYFANAAGSASQLKNYIDINFWNNNYKTLIWNIINT